MFWLMPFLLFVMLTRHWRRERWAVAGRRESPWLERELDEHRVYVDGLERRVAELEEELSRSATARKAANTRARKATAKKATAKKAAAKKAAANKAAAETPAATETAATETASTETAATTTADS